MHSGRDQYNHREKQTSTKQGAIYVFSFASTAQSCFLCCALLITWDLECRGCHSLLSASKYIYFWQQIECRQCIVALNVLRFKYQKANRITWRMSLIKYFCQSNKLLLTSRCSEWDLCKTNFPFGRRFDTERENLLPLEDSQWFSSPKSMRPFFGEWGTLPYICSCFENLHYPEQRSWTRAETSWHLREGEDVSRPKVSCEQLKVVLAVDQTWVFLMAST